MPPCTRAVRKFVRSSFGRRVRNRLSRLSWFQRFRPGIGVLAGLCAASISSAEVLYDLTFDAPHLVGYPAVESFDPAPRRVLSPSSEYPPIVVESHGDLTDRPAFFDFDSDGSNPENRIMLRLEDLPGAPYQLPLSEHYSIRLDLLITEGDGDAGIAVHLAAPAVRRVDFLVDGSAHGFVSGEGPFLLPAFTVGEVLHLRIDVDLDADTWTVFYDGAEVYTGPFGSASVIETLTIVTGYEVIGGSVVGAVDNIRVIIPEEGPCDRVTFNDLDLGDSWVEGESFVSNDVRVDVEEFFFDVGPCSGSSASGSVSVVGTDLACAAGKELSLSNVTLDFDFHGGVTDVLIRYGEYGGTVSLGVNGDCHVVDRMVDLSGLVLGGVAVTVFDEQPNQQGCGVIRLGGTVEQLSIGGQEFFVDQISYCPECGELRRSAFDDQVVGTQFEVGDSFTSGSATHTLRAFSPPGADCRILDAGGVATIGNGLLACQQAREIGLNNILDEIDFGEPITWLALGYGEFGGNVNLSINGECRNADNFDDLSGELIGDVFVWAVDYGDPGQSCGTLYAVGSIEEFCIGGQELWIDNIRTCLDATAEVGEGGASTLASGILHLAQNRPNPFATGTRIRFDLARGASATISIHDVAGRLVRSLAEERFEAGSHDLWWDGRDDHGRDAAAGSYLCRVTVGEAAAARRIVKLP